MVDFFPGGQFTVEKLRAIVAGNDTSIPRIQAIAMLVSSDYPDSEKDFELLLENQGEPSTIRYLAAISLAKINSARARKVLTKNTQTEDEEVLAGIMTALSRIGNEESIDAILNVKERTTGYIASQAEFAAALISFRLGLEGNDLPIPHSQDYLDLKNSVSQMQIFEAVDEEIRKCIQSLAEEPFGIKLAKNPAYQVYYDRGVGMVLFNLDLLNRGNTQILLKKKSFLGIIADKVEESGRYSVAYLILTSPSNENQKTNILIARPDGTLVFGGVADIETDSAKFSIRTISQIGVFPVLIEGTLKRNNLELTTAQFSTVIQNKLQPELYKP